LTFYFEGSDSIDPIGNDGGEVNGSQEVSGEFVVAGSDTPEILEAAKWPNSIALRQSQVVPDRAERIPRPK
jgi:hypothetical protein